MQEFDFFEIASDPSHYILVPEDDVNLQYLYQMGESYAKMKNKNFEQYFESISHYDSLVHTTAQIVRELGIQGNSTSYYTVFAYLLWNGFLSWKENYIYDKHQLLGIEGFDGIDVICGRGSCRAIADFFQRVLRQFDFRTHFLVNSVHTTSKYHYPAIDRYDKEGMIPQSSTFSSDRQIDIIGNHASVLLLQDSNYYIYDVTNLSVYKVDDPLVAHLYNGVGECHIKPWGFLMYEQWKQRDLLNWFSMISQQNPSSFWSDTEIQEITDETLNECKKNQDLLLDFHHQIRPKVKKIYKSCMRKNK